MPINICSLSTVCQCSLFNLKLSVFAHCDGSVPTFMVYMHCSSDAGS